MEFWKLGLAARSKDLKVPVQHGSDTNAPSRHDLHIFDDRYAFWCSCGTQYRIRQPWKKLFPMHLFGSLIFRINHYLTTERYCKS